MQRPFGNVALVNQRIQKTGTCLGTASPVDLSCRLLVYSILYWYWTSNLQLAVENSALYILKSRN